MAFSGIIPLMRVLHRGACATSELAKLANLSGEQVRARLRTLQNTFGAAGQTNGKWHLTFQPQWLDPAQLSASLPDLAVTVLEETPGTNELAKAAKINSVFFAEHQIHGRGRYSRNWLAMPGGQIAMSLRLPAPPELAGFSLAIGAALWRALQGADAGLQLKWPNDLLDAQGQKIGGILIENAGNSIIVGTGFNLHMTEKLRASINRPVGVLACSLPRNDCAALLAKTVQEASANFALNGLSHFLPDIVAAHVLQDGQEMSFTSAKGEERGRFAGFGNEGELLMRRNGDVQRFFSGEITHVAGC